MRKFVVIFMTILIFSIPSCTKNVQEDSTTSTSAEIKENMAKWLSMAVIEICEDREFPFYVENSLGKDMPNEVFSMAERAGLLEFYSKFSKVELYDYNSTDIEQWLFKDTTWYEVTESEKQTIISSTVDSGYIRIYNDNGEEFIVLKETNAAIYKNSESARYFTWFYKNGNEGCADDFCNWWYDALMMDTRQLEMMVIDDDAGKTREELAYEIMETYRKAASTLLSDNGFRFEELIIISLESYDESDSDTESMIGVITEDLLKFNVSYAVNSDNADGVLIAGWYYEEEGVYKGYMVHGYMIEAKLYEGKWYCTAMSNG